MSENTKSNITNVEMSESDLESQSLYESDMRTAEPSAVTETAVGGDVIVHSTPIAAHIQLSETDVDSGIQLTPVLTNKNKQSDEMDIMSFLQQQFNIINVNLSEQKNEMQEIKSNLNEQIKLSNVFDIKFDMQNNQFKELNKRFDSNEITLNEMKSDFNLSLIHILCIILKCVFTWLGAVSYTHLDVYKRQT